jgi:hypothetical protein
MSGTKHRQIENGSRFEVILTVNFYVGIGSQAVSRRKRRTWRHLHLCGGAAPDLAGKFLGGTLSQALAAPVKVADGGTDLCIDQEKFHDHFARDVGVDDAALMAAGRRSITEAALAQKSGKPAYKRSPTSLKKRAMSSTVSRKTGPCDRSSV